MRLETYPALPPVVPHRTHAPSPAPSPAPAPLTGDPCRGHTPTPRWVLVACLAILDGERTEPDPPAQTGARGQA